MEKIIIETHPNWYHDIPHMEILILGSFPPHESKRKYEFYYPNTQNRFWKILAEIANMPLGKYPKFAPELVLERHRIMEILDVGVQNMGYKVKRNGISALDTNIEITEYHDILSIIKSHPELKTILLPGYSAQNSTLRSFLRYLAQNEIHAPEIKDPKGGVTQFSIKIEDRILECKVLNSTSTAAKIKYETILEQFTNAIKHQL